DPGGGCGRRRRRRTGDGMDGHADSLNHEARVKTSGLHGATALPAVLPKRGDSSQGAQVTLDRFVPWVVRENGRSVDRGGTVRSLVVIPTRARRSALDSGDSMGALRVRRHDDARLGPDPGRVIAAPFFPRDEVYPDGTS